MSGVRKVFYLPCISKLLVGDVFRDVKKTNNLFTKIKLGLYYFRMSQIKPFTRICLFVCHVFVMKTVIWDGG